MDWCLFLPSPGAIPLEGLCCEKSQRNATSDSFTAATEGRGHLPPDNLLPGNPPNTPPPPFRKGGSMWVLHRDKDHSPDNYYTSVCLIFQRSVTRVCVQETSADAQQHLWEQRNGKVINTDKQRGRCGVVTPVQHHSGFSLFTLAPL